MATLALFAAAGAVTWLLRATLIVLVPSGEVVSRLAGALRYAAPAAFASMAATSVAAAAKATGHGWWQFAIAAVVTGLVAKRTRNLALCIAASAITITLLTAF